MELTGGRFSITVEDVLTSETGVAAVVRSRADRDGRQLDDRQVHLFRLEHGRAAEVWQFTGEGADAFWS
jgi:ketosteroid isomerase-like protein